MKTRKGAAAKRSTKVASALVLGDRPAARSYHLKAKTLGDSFGRAYKRRGARELLAIQKTFLLNTRELGELFGRVKRQAVEQWLERGVPIERMADVSRVTELATLLAGTFKRDRLPTIVRAPLPGLSNSSILDTIRDDGTAKAFDLLERLYSWTPVA